MVQSQSQRPSYTDIERALTNRFRDLVTDLIYDYYTESGSTDTADNLIIKLLDLVQPDIESAASDIEKFVRDNLNVELEQN